MKTAKKLEEAAQDDEERRKKEKPCLTKQQAAKALLYLWDIKVSTEKMKKLDSYDDQNFYCCSSDGVEYTLKIHNGVESDNWRFITMQNELLSHLSKTFPCPKPVPCFSGQMMAFGQFHVKGFKKKRCLVVRLLTWVPGSVLIDTKHGRDTTGKTGEALYALQKSISYFKHPSIKQAHRAHQWDLKNMLGITPYIKYVKADVRPFVERALELFKTKVVPVSKHFTTGVMHNDFNDANILVSEDGARVTGILDFGDTVYTWMVAELGVAMAYAMLTKYGKTNPLDALAAFLEGWRKAGGKLNSYEESAVRILAACRLAVSITLGALSYSKQPENKYLLVHAKPAWDALKLLIPTLES